MTDVKLTFAGGEALKEKLQYMAKGLGQAKSVRMGFLESATYPVEGGARLADAAKRAQKEGKTEWASLLARWAAWAEKHPRTLKVAQVAFWQEFGTKRSKPRPFFRKMIMERSGGWAQALGRYIKGSDYDAGKAMSKLGVRMSEELVESIDSWPADNKPLTAFIKQFSHGLIDRAIMKRSVDFEVRDG